MCVPVKEPRLPKTLVNINMFIHGILGPKGGIKMGQCFWCNDEALGKGISPRTYSVLPGRRIALTLFGQARRSFLAYAAHCVSSASTS